MTRQLFINVYPGGMRGYQLWSYTTLAAAREAMRNGCLYRIRVTYKPHTFGKLQPSFASVHPLWGLA